MGKVVSADSDMKKKCQKFSRVGIGAQKVLHEMRKSRY